MFKNKGYANTNSKSEDKQPLIPPEEERKDKSLSQSVPNSVKSKHSANSTNKNNKLDCLI